MDNKNVEIVIYTSTTCPYCEMAKDYFKSKGIEYEEKSTTDPENRKKLVSMGIRGVPTIFVGEKHFVGFDPNEIEKLISDTAGDQSPESPEETIRAEGNGPLGAPAGNAKAVIVAGYDNKDKEVVKGEVNMDKYVCTVCGYVYDPEVGDEDNGVKPGTSFVDLPEDWVCPACGVGKDMFEKE